MEAEGLTAANIVAYWQEAADSGMSRSRGATGFIGLGGDGGIAFWTFAVPGSVLAGFSGFAIERTGFIWFFVGTSLIGLPVALPLGLRLGQDWALNEAWDRSSGSPVLWRTVVDYHCSLARGFRCLRPSPHKLNQGQLLFFVFGLNGLLQRRLGMSPQNVYR